MNVYNDASVPKFDNLLEALFTAPPTRPFVTFWINDSEHETVTFGEFRRRASLQAAILRDQGATPGDRLVIIMPQGIPAMTVFVGAMMLGAVPAFLAYPNMKVEPAKYRSGLAGVTANLGAKLVVLDEGFPNEMLSHVSLSQGTRLLGAGSGHGSGGEEHGFRVDNARDRVAFIQHSAGTTGLQKGVALTHAAVLRQIEYVQQALKIDGSSDCIYSWLPLYHDMGLVACFMLPLACHVPLVLQSPVDWVMQPETMVEIVAEYQCTVAWLPNFAFQFVPRRTRLERLKRPDLSSLRALINCSEPVRAASMQEFHDAFAAIGFRLSALQSSYAMAENVFAVTQSDIERSSGPRRLWADGREFRSAHRIVPLAEAAAGAVGFVSSGQLLPNHQIRITSDSGADLPAGHVGEILVKSDCLFAGYYNRPDLTAQAIIEGWYHTGDLGFYLDRELYVVGRKKDLIIVGGENIYPQDIEEIVASYPGIHDGRVVALGAYNPEIGTEEIILVAEVENERLLVAAREIEEELRNRVVAGMGVAVGTIYLKPPKWIVKSTAGKLARSATLEKLSRDHPELMM